MEKLVEKLQKIVIDNVVVKTDINLERFTTIKLGGLGSMAQCYTEEALLELIKECKRHCIKYHLVGWGANQVLLHTKDTLFIKLEFPFYKKLVEDHLDKHCYHLPASTSLNQLTSLASKHGLKGWEVFTGIPASLGGAICMNAGTSLGAIGDLICDIRILNPEGRVRNYVCDNKHSFSYRENHFLKPGEVILSATIKDLGTDLNTGKVIADYLTKRKISQPLDTKNCGSVFKNHEQFAAGRLIDLLGLKCFGLSNLKVSQKHGNFIEHSLGATAEEFDQLVLLLKDEIERYSGLKFELEVKVY